MEITLPVHKAKKVRKTELEVEGRKITVTVYELTPADLKDR